MIDPPCLHKHCILQWITSSHRFAECTDKSTTDPIFKSQVIEWVKPRSSRSLLYFRKHQPTRVNQQRWHVCDVEYMCISGGMIQTSCVLMKHYRSAHGKQRIPNGWNFDKCLPAAHFRPLLLVDAQTWSRRFSLTTYPLCSGFSLTLRRFSACAVFKNTQGPSASEWSFFHSHG